MSQYPPPSSPPPFGGPPIPYTGFVPRDPAAPARRASVMMWVLGTTLVLLGTCMAVALMPAFEYMLAHPQPGQAAEMEKVKEQLRAQEARTGVPMGKAAMQGGIVMLVVGAGLGVMAFFVRGAGRGSAITAAVLTGLMLGYLCLNTLATLNLGGSVAAGGLCLLVVSSPPLVILLIWLVQAAQSAPTVASAQRQGGTGRPHAPPPQSIGIPPTSYWLSPPPPPPPPGQLLGSEYGYAQRPPSPPTFHPAEGNKGSGEATPRG